MRLAITTIYLAASMGIYGSRNLPTFTLERVKHFTVGRNRGELDVNINFSERNGPANMAFDSEGNLYIADILNNRLVKFDPQFNYITDYENCYAPGIEQFFIRERGGYKTLTWHTRPAKPPVERKKKRELPLRLEDYQEEQRLLESGEPESDLEAVEIDLAGLKERGLIVEGERAPRDYNHFLEEVKRREGKIEHARGIDNDYLAALKLTYLGHDVDKNYYWYSPAGELYIFNRKGRLIEAFRYDGSSFKGYPALHPSGDIYFIFYNKAYLLLKRIGRKW